MGITLNESTIEELLQTAKTTVDLCNTILNTKPDEDGDDDAEPATKIKTTKKKASKKKTTHKKTSKKKAEESEDDMLEDEGGDDEFNFDDDEPGDSEGPTLDDVKKEFKTFVGKFSTTKVGRENAKKVLQKFKAKSMDTIDEGDYEAVIKLLKSKK